MRAKEQKNEVTRQKRHEKKEERRVRAGGGNERGDQMKGPEKDEAEPH